MARSGQVFGPMWLARAVASLLTWVRPRIDQTFSDDFEAKVRSCLEPCLQPGPSRPIGGLACAGSTNDRT
eukprot:8313545-Pyramimonas_sp.AAC.1